MSHTGIDIQVPFGASQIEIDLLRNVREYIQSITQFGAYCPPMTSTDKPDATDFTYRCFYVTNTNKPAWSDGTTWRYADGTSV